MTDYSEAPFFAIGATGYGKGFTAKEAEENYCETQAANFPGLHRMKKQRIKIVRESWPATVYQAPEGANGFVSGFGWYWTKDDQRIREFQSEDIVRQP